MYWICAMCCANNSVIDSELNEFWSVATDNRVAPVNTGPAGAVVGLFGFWLRAVRSVLHATAVASAMAATEYRMVLIFMYEYPLLAITV
jgi:hypothetical protein